MMSFTQTVLPYADLFGVRHTERKIENNIIDHLILKSEKHEQFITYIKSFDAVL